MATLQDEQPSFDRAICDAVVASVPETWNVIVLTLDRPKNATQVGDLQHSISGPEGLPSAMPDASLYDATYRLDELLQRYGGMFRRAVYRVEFMRDSWQYTAEFEYDPVSPK